MPDLKKIVKRVGDVVEKTAQGSYARLKARQRLYRKKILLSVDDVVKEAARESNSPLQARQGRGPSRRATHGCAFWACQVTVKQDHAFCSQHDREHQDGRINTCPNCGRGKYVTYELCLDCRNSPPARTAAAPPDRYPLEHSETWEKGDAGANEFFVYILRLEGRQEAGFYAGQTRELRERLSEHRDGKEKATAGRNPKLVWFEVVQSRQVAAEREAELKRLIDRNPREVRRRVIKFQDLVREIQNF